MKYYVTLATLALSFITPKSLASEALCRSWSATETIAHLPAKDFPEVSGMVASPHIPGRLYFVNDSGDGAHFYSYDLETGNYEKVEVLGFKGWDIEALSFGPCGKGRSCIYVGDIGDNQERRKIIRVAGVVEKQRYGSSVKPLFHKILTYPDEATDAEAMVVSKKGFLYLFSKEFGIFSADPTKLYRIKLSRLLRSGQESLESMGTISMAGSLMTPLLTVTDAALSPDESKLFLLGYMRSYEVSFDDLLEQARQSQTLVLNYREFRAGAGLQTESATYSADGESILWTYESKSKDAPLMKRTCL